MLEWMNLTEVAINVSKRLFCQTIIFYFLAKPRILAPNNGGREGKEIPADAPKFTVNELSAESIKRGFYF